MEFWNPQGSLDHTLKTTILNIWFFYAILTKIIF